MSRSRNRKRGRPQPARQATHAPVTSQPQQATPPTQQATPPAQPTQSRQPQQRKRRLRSTYVILGSVGTIFAGLCLYGVVRDRDRDRTCVDANNNVVSNRECDNGSGGARWYYGGINSGGKMNGGSFERSGFGGHGGGGS